VRVTVTIGGSSSVKYCDYKTTETITAVINSPLTLKSPQNRKLYK